MLVIGFNNEFLSHLYLFSVKVKLEDVMTIWMNEDRSMRPKWIPKVIFLESTRRKD